MKIGILTFHREINYGACLQAYALLTHIKKMENNVEIIDFIPNSEVDRRSWKRKTLHFIKTLLSPSERHYQTKKKKFVSFWNKHLILSNEKAYGDNNLQNIVSKYDLLISGSDQVLNLTLSDNSFSYYLPFENKRKISYASSFGREAVSDLEKWAILKYLPSFSNLSFRETSGYQIVNDLISLEQKNIVVDPVFLLEKSEWGKMVGKKNRTKNYILIYAMEQTDWIESTIESVSKTYPNHKLLLIQGSNCNLNLSKKHRLIKTAGPEEFLSLISDSSLIITNSFHGLAFSFIFKKKVYCCAHSSKNTRLESLLTLAGEKNNIITSETVVPLPIDGSEALLKIENLISESKEYLFNNIGWHNYDR